MWNLTGSTILAVNTREDVREITELEIPDGNSEQTFEVGFVVEDVAATIELFREKGMPVVKEPVTKPWGQTVAYVADPDGNYIEICSLME